MQNKNITKKPNRNLTFSSHKKKKKPNGHAAKWWNTKYFLWSYSMDKPDSYQTETQQRAWPAQPRMISPGPERTEEWRWKNLFSCSPLIPFPALPCLPRLHFYTPGLPHLRPFIAHFAQSNTSCPISSTTWNFCIKYRKLGSPEMLSF